MKNPNFLAGLAVLAGLLVAMFAVTLLEIVGVLCFPLPPGVDPTNEAQLKQIIEQGKLPTGALVCVLLAWVFGAGVGSWSAAKLSPIHKLFCGWLVGTLLFVATLLMLFELPHPILFSISAVLLVPLASWFGSQFALPRTVD